MPKYKIGDVVRIVSERPADGLHWNDKMDRWLGEIMTIRGIEGVSYKMVEDFGDATCNHTPGWCWDDSMIEGLVEDDLMVDPEEDAELDDFISEFLQK